MHVSTFKIIRASNQIPGHTQLKEITHLVLCRLCSFINVVLSESLQFLMQVQLDQYANRSIKLIVRFPTKLF